MSRKREVSLCLTVSHVAAPMLDKFNTIFPPDNFASYYAAGSGGYGLIIEEGYDDDTKKFLNTLRAQLKENTAKSKETFYNAIDPKKNTLPKKISEKALRKLRTFILEYAELLKPSQVEMATKISIGKQPSR